MKPVDIADDIYEFLLRNTKTFGETPSDVIRRLLGLKQAEAAGATILAASAPQRPLGSTQAGNGAGNFLSSPGFLVQGNAVGKFLAILSWLHKQSPEKFEKVLLLNGRKRRYFGRSADELEASGNSVMPKRIPETPYWVFTNSPTLLKKQVLTDVMRVLGYDSATTHSIVETVK